MQKATRGGLHALLKRFALTAIEHDDQQYGRQLATICEQVAASLRIKFGGRSLLLTSHSPGAKKTAQNPNGETHEQRVIRGFRLAYGHPEPTVAWLTEQLGASYETVAQTIVARVAKMRGANPPTRQYAVTHDAVTTDAGKRIEIPIWPAVDNLSTGVPS